MSFSPGRMARRVHVVVRQILSPGNAAGDEKIDGAECSVNAMP
jgi:hypothetical protein